MGVTKENKKVKVIVATFLIIILILVAGTTLLIGYMMYSDKLLVRMPALMQENPIITFVIGDANYREDKDSKWQQSIVGTELEKGFEVKTEKNSIVDIRFHDQMAIRLSEKSSLKLDDLTVRKIGLNVENGSIFGKFAKVFKDHTISVKTPTSLAAIRGTELGFEVIELQDDTAPARS